MQWKTWSGLAAACLMLAALPLSAEEIIASGEFYNAHHPTSGRALIVARDGGGYELPDGVSPERFKSAAIWCRTYSVMFGAAPLEPQ